MLIKLTREVSGLDSSFALRLLQTGNKCRCIYAIVARGKASKFLTCERTEAFNLREEKQGHAVPEALWAGVLMNWKRKARCPRREWQVCEKQIV